MRVLLVVQTDPESDESEADRVVRRLRSELDDLDVDAVRPMPDGAVPAGAKGADPVTVGALLVALSASGGVFTTLVGTLGAWLDRQSGRHRITVTVGGDSIELERATAAEQKALIDAFVRRHSGERAD
ncbi:hypothetical protein BJY16_004942 [Actinoplanes octamycinicus]|uniref:Uncharacterized protein n=1 Tax=Actinoplanes octamycinicus TaxID=135948 RepID=A0A7W7M8Z5_9ACTN|nr:hypothetical protein [Actinoplanes octamycinicus]MBB4741483.1 hypothetical protein [Actinoplanes octamycinicus]GIE57033.1 hypothetical protein Aoc01nite_24350 [Actinoplanes octamycinicus]